LLSNRLVGLATTLDEEETTYELLSELADATVNAKAASPSRGVRRRGQSVGVMASDNGPLGSKGPPRDSTFAVAKIRSRVAKEHAGQVSFERRWN